MKEIDLHECKIKPLEDEPYLAALYYNHCPEKDLPCFIMWIHTQTISTMCPFCKSPDMEKLYCAHEDSEGIQP